MTIKAQSALKPEIRIEDAVIIVAAWGDSVSYYAVDQGDWDSLGRFWLSKGATSVRCLKDAEARAAIERNVWIGIRECTSITPSGGIAAWGHANVTFEDAYLARLTPPPAFWIDDVTGCSVRF